MVFSFNRKLKVKFWNKQVLIQELKHEEHIKYSRRSLTLHGSSLHGEKDRQEDLYLEFVSLEYL